MLFDSHAHLNFSAFNKDREEVIKKCLDENVWMINIGTNCQTSQKAIEIAEKYSQGVYPHHQNFGVGVYAAIGLHPINLETDLIKQKTDSEEGGRFEKEFDYEKYKQLALSSKKVIAIGEIGLDFWRRPKTKKKQEEFKKQQKELLLEEIKLAQELSLPIIFHCRLGFKELLEVVEEVVEVRLPRFPRGSLTSTIHSFTGTWQEAKKFLDLGFCLGFNGIIYKLDLNEVIKNTPLDKILLETDCPYLTPPNFPEERNNPLAAKFIAEYIAKIKNEPLEKIAATTFQNAKQLFNI